MKICANDFSTAIYKIIKLHKQFKQTRILYNILIFFSSDIFSNSLL